jgi:hypothetical protein
MMYLKDIDLDKWQEFREKAKYNILSALVVILLIMATVGYVVLGKRGM